MDTEVSETVGGSRAKANHRRIRKYREVETVLFSVNNPLDRELINLANEVARKREKSVQDTLRFLGVLTLKNYNKTLDGKSTTQSTDQEFDD
jgi:hypothetical protein